MIEQIAFIGLGAMGSPMAGHLQRAGYQVTVYNRSPEKAERWCARYGGASASTPAEAARGAQLVIICVGADQDVLAVTMGEQGVFQTMSAGSLLIDHTTTSSGLALQLNARAAAGGLRFLDAPISGGQVGAERGALTVMLGGSEADLAWAEPALRVYAKQLKLMGPAGSGQLTKMVNQLCIAGVLGGLSEAFHFAECVGLDIKEVAHAIQGGAAQSWQLDNRHQTMAEAHYDFGFALDWMRKDLAFSLELAEGLGLELPIARLVDAQYEQLQGSGKGRWDTSALIEALRARHQLKRERAEEALVTHSGGCHCGQVAWEVRAPAVLETHTCNCSICVLQNFQHLIVPKSRFTLLKGEEHLSTYRFGTGVAQHHFCANCGVKSFYIPRSNPDGVSVHVRCIEPATIEAIFDTPFDGQNWEQNAARLAQLSEDSSPSRRGER